MTTTQPTAPPVTAKPRVRRHKLDKKCAETAFAMWEAQHPMEAFERRLAELRASDAAEPGLVAAVEQALFPLAVAA